MANDVLQLVIAGRVAGQFWESVQHYQSNVDTGPNPVGLATNLIAGWRANVEGAFADCLATDADIIGYKAKRVNNGGGPVVMTPIAAFSGSFTGTSATSATAGVVITAYQHLMKWHAGRWFLPALSEDALDGNEFDASYIGVVNAFIAANVSFASGGKTFSSGVWSRKFALFFTGAYQGLSQKPGIQKRRLLPSL